MIAFKDFLEQAAENATFILVSLLIVTVVFVLAYIAELLIQKKQKVKEKVEVV